MQPIQNPVLSIAGFDPSAGAGILADIKTLEQVGVYGCGVASSITYQNDLKFNGVKWLTFDEIERQFIILTERFRFAFAKIGLIETMETLINVVRMLKKHNSDIRIIWDPVLKTSSGFQIHSEDIAHEIGEIANELFLITPNAIEAEILNAGHLTSKCNILVKGGHNTDDLATDILYSTDGSTIRINGHRQPGMEKHGSGCVMSSAITAFLSLGYSLEQSCRNAKEYTIQFLQNSSGLLGHHNQIRTNEPTYAIAS